MINAIATTIFIIFLIFSSPIFAQDTLQTISTGYGDSHEIALQDAIRSAAEQASGLLLSSNTIIDNFAVVNDDIISSANAYVYKYDILQDTLFSDKSLFQIKIKAFLAKDIMRNTLISKIEKHDSVDSKSIDMIRSEFTGATTRAENAKKYLYRHIQSHFLDLFSYHIDSISVIDKNIPKQTTRARLYYSFGLKLGNKELYDQIIYLINRLDNFNGASHRIIFEINFILDVESYRQSERTALYNLDRLTSSSLKYKLTRKENIQGATSENTNEATYSCELKMFPLKHKPPHQTHLNVYDLEYSIGEKIFFSLLIMGISTWWNESSPEINKAYYKYDFGNYPEYLKDSVQIPYISFINSNHKLKPTINGCYNDFLEAEIPISHFTAKAFRANCNVYLGIKPKNSTRLSNREVLVPISINGTNSEER